jgi:uncharacterized protein
MTDQPSNSCTAFQGFHILHAGSRLEVALAVKRSMAAGATQQILVFDDRTGRIVDLDLRGNDAEITERLVSPTPGSAELTDTKSNKRGRPRLGVVSREVTLLPRHWEWLAAQRGGASAALRRIVDEARRRPDDDAEQRAAAEAAYNFMHAIAGDFPGYEEAIRALFAGDQSGLKHHMAGWPDDIRSFALHLAFEPLAPIEGGATPR